MKYYVYHLIDSSTGKPFYVGKGTRRRCYEHIYDAGRPHERQDNPLKCSKINTLFQQQIDIIVRQVEFFDNEQDALTFEEQEIQKYGRLCDGTGILTNVLLGGQQPPAQPKKKVFCFNNTGELVYTFDSTFAAADSLGVNVSVIQNCCAGRCKTTRGYALFYHSTPTTHELSGRFLQQRAIQQTVYQIDDARRAVNTYSSLTEAATAHNTESRRISSAVKFNRRHKGFYWSLSAPV